MARKRQQIQMPLDRRTLTVWAVLVGSLSLVSGILFALDPTPHAPAVGHVLTVLNPSPSDFQSLLHTRDPITEGRWKSIVIDHSGSARGSAETLGREHQAAGLRGLGYHFVIGNGDGAYDGEIQAGYRWDRQLDGMLYRDTIAICLIGDGDNTAPTRAQMEQLAKLVTALQRQLGISPEEVSIHREISTQTTSPGVLFENSWFRKQLIDVRSSDD